MSTAVTTTGILLRAHPYSESSKVLRFLTPEHGLVSVIGRGVRSRRHRSEAPLETFGEGVLTFSLRPHRDLHTLQDFRQLTGAIVLGRDPLRFIGASLWAELLLAHALQGGDEALYEWVRSALAHLGVMEAERVPDWILAGGWRILALLGFPPELELCVRCGEEIGTITAGGSLAHFTVAGGGVICPGCVGAERYPRIGPGALEQLRGFISGEPAPGGEGRKAHLGLLEAFATFHLGGERGRGEIRSFSILRSLQGAEGQIFLDPTSAAP